MKKKILIDSIYINNGGGKVLLDYLIEYIIDKNIVHNFYFLLDSRGEYSFLDIIDYQIGKNDERFRKKFYKFNRIKFKKIFCFGNVPPPIKLSIPVFTYFHNVLLAKSVRGYPIRTKLIKFIKRFYIRYNSKNTDEYWVQSSFVSRMIRSKISNNTKVRVLPFFNLNRGEVSIKEEISFVYVSNGNPHKNHEKLLLAWERIHDKGIRLNLHLTVTSEYHKIIKEIDRLQRKGVLIINHGYIDVGELYKEASHLIYPSLTESFGLGLVEAVNAGLSVVASDLPYVHEVVEPSYVFNPLEVGSIIAVVEDVLLDSNEKKSKIIIKNKIDKLINYLC